jgi:hypothetical protein
MVAYAIYLDLRFPVIRGNLLNAFFLRKSITAGPGAISYLP